VTVFVAYFRAFCRFHTQEEAMSYNKAGIGVHKKVLMSWSSMRVRRLGSGRVPVAHHSKR
jgi:hypothetical protein